MKVKVMTMAFDPEHGGFDGAELDAFMEHHEVIDVREEFFVHERSPWLMLLLAYRTTDVAVMSGTSRRGREGGATGRGTERDAGRHRRDPVAELDAGERTRFEALRAWRNARAIQDGVSPYVVMTNAQLAAVVRSNPGSLSALQQVDGIGTGRIERYGADVLAVLGAADGEAKEGAGAAASGQGAPAVPSEEGARG